MTVDKTKAFQAVTYAGGTTLALWGVIEIFLRIDPFLAVCFKDLLLFGVAIMSVAGAATLFRWVWSPPALWSEATARFLVTALSIGLGITVILLFFAPAFATLCSDDPVLPTALTVFRVIIVSVAVTCFAASAVQKLHEGIDLSQYPAWYDVQLLVPTAVVGLFVVSISLGRSEEIRRADIAQEELRQAGLSFSVNSLQDAIFLNSPRSVSLFVEADVDATDIELALRTPTRFNSNDALVSDVMRRISEPNLNCSDLDSPGCQRIRNFLEMFREEQQSSIIKNTLEISQNLNLIGDIFSTEEVETADDFCDKVHKPLVLPRSVRDGAPPRSLISHALTGGYGAILGPLVKECGRPEPGASIFATAVDLPPGDDPERQAAALQTRRLHALGVIDPHIAIHDAARTAPGLWTKDEAAMAREALCAAGVHPSGAFGIVEAPEVCDEDRPAGSQPPEVRDQPPEVRDVVDIGTSPAAGCSLLRYDVALSPLDLGPRGGMDNDGNAELPQAFLMEAAGDAGDRLGVLQRRDGETRAVMLPDGVDGELAVAVFGWNGDLNVGDGTWTISDFDDGHTIDRTGAKRRLYLFDAGQSKAAGADWLQPALPPGIKGVDGEDRAAWEWGDEKVWSATDDGRPVAAISLSLNDAAAIRVAGLSAEGCLSVQPIKDTPGEPIALHLDGQERTVVETPLLHRGDYELTLATVEPSAPAQVLRVAVLDKPPCRIPTGNQGAAWSLSQKVTKEGEFDVSDTTTVHCDLLIEDALILSVSVGSSEDITLDLQDSNGASVLPSVVDNGQPETFEQTLQQGLYRLIVATYGDTDFEDESLDFKVTVQALPGPLGSCRLDATPGDPLALTQGFNGRDDVDTVGADIVRCTFTLEEALTIDATAISNEDIEIAVLPIGQDEDTADWTDRTSSGSEVITQVLGPGNYTFAAKHYSDGTPLGSIVSMQLRATSIGN